jgi:PHS family inorganic phosphate transporter-like MFS transporter
MMAAVFIMQPVGQLVAWAVGMAALKGLTRDYNLDVGVLTTNPDEIDNAKIGIDIFWRIVVGVGAIPALIAILFRWTIPESGRYTYDVKQDARTALKDTRKVYEQQTAMQSRATELSEFTLESGVPQTHNEHHSQDLMPQLTGTTSALDASFDGFDRSSIGSNDGDMWEIPNPDDDDDEYNQFSYAELHTYFIKEGNWRYLAGTSIAWLLLDFAFVSPRTSLTTPYFQPTNTPPQYGLGFNNPGTMAKLWTEERQINVPSTPSWLLNSPYDESGTIRQVLQTNASHTTLTTSVASILGAIAITCMINRIDRRRALIWSFAALALALLVLAILFRFLFHTPHHWVLVVFYAVVQFGFAFGPNTLTFIVSAEIYPTRYRCTCYGISAACGKLGSVFVQLAFLFFDGGGIKDPNSMALGKIIFIFAVFMLVGALVSWAWIPSVQDRELEKPYTLRTKTLEELSGGLQSVKEENRVGIRAQVKEIRKRIRK